MNSWTLHTWTLDSLDFPPEIVMTRELAVVLAVASYRAKDHPWGGFAVMLVLPEMANVKPIARGR